jgi:hypothetical protein
MKRWQQLLCVLCLSGAPLRALAELTPAAQGHVAPTEHALSTQPSGAVQAPLELPANLESWIFFNEKMDSVDANRERQGHALLERLLREREHWVVERRARAIKELTAFVATEPEVSPLMADALLRLAELKWEQARADYLVAFEQWQRTKPADRHGQAPVCLTWWRRWGCISVCLTSIAISTATTWCST